MGAWFDLDPAKRQRNKHERKNERGRSSKSEEPAIRDLMPPVQGSREDQFEYADADRHEDNQEGDSNKADPKTPEGGQD